MHHDSSKNLITKFQSLEKSLHKIAHELAVFLVYDRPDRAKDRPGIERAFFSQRCVSDIQLDQTLTALRSIGVYVELLNGEQDFINKLSNGHIDSVSRKIKLVYNGIEGGIAFDGFQPGRKSLIPAVADSYDLLCSNSNAYACALGRHKFHYFKILQAFGLKTPKIWHYRLIDGWVNAQPPAKGIRVIAKSTFESWSVGVTEESKFIVDESCEERVKAIAQSIGQSVCVQEFIPGAEVCVPVFSIPELLTTPSMQAILAKAPCDPEAIMTIDDNLTGGAVTYHLFESSPEIEILLSSMAIKAFRVLELEVFARIDFRVDLKGVPWIFDIGVSPGLSRGSSAFASVAELGFSHSEFLRIVIASTLAQKGLLPNFHARIQSQAS